MDRVTLALPARVLGRGALCGAFSNDKNVILVIKGGVIQ